MGLYRVIVVKLDEKEQFVEVLKDLGVLVAKGDQAARAKGILACPKEVADGTASVVFWRHSNLCS